MDANQVKTFCDVVGQLIVPLSTYAGVEPGKRDPADDVLVASYASPAPRSTTRSGRWRG
jgi:hypothetical protein